ncbi:multiple sugar transport system substrate-binding protein [Gemmobacter caeni]|uniref:Carbohydrate ABC transporter substrate-binding protein (CUT1 family) n=1 Tax=Gemmobacter caeni TaxID=589035 RepID=A0A2T6AWJ3_9RHOB|nr:extracellular solute-binding protein [Gemmobacter caeni]PTX48179.1 carbohydrate ABC transporter substrate-binding protein (CUT1 family) [Gemmobacter caeni]TWI96955.1 multiple sugar transport system substrate-binding protein [Gemmobacter caeni]
MTRPMQMNRRGFLASATGTLALLAAAPALAAGKVLNILSHRVHQAVLGEGEGDLMAGWKTANDADLAFTTFDSNPLMDRLFREASLPETEFSLGYMVDNRPTSDIARLFEPLDGWQEKDPIADFADLAPGLIKGMTIDGKLIGIPVRTATQALFYNEDLLEQAGFTAPPATLEELVAQAQKISADKIATGMVLASDLAVFPVMFARAFGGDFLTQDFRLLPDPAAMEQALTVLAGMFADGSLPRSYATTKNDDQVTWMQQGRAAFTVLPFARAAQLNNPEQSKFPGRIKAVGFPVTGGLVGKTPMAAVVEAWAMVIPANARDKDLAWSYIRQVSSPETTLGMALNGNGAARVSTFSDPRLIEKNPLAAIEAEALANARGAFPPFPEAARAQALLLEEVQLAVMGRKTPAEAVAAISERVAPLLP